MFWTLTIIWTALFAGITAWPHVFKSETIPTSVETCRNLANGSDGKLYCLDNGRVIPYEQTRVVRQQYHPDPNESD